MQPPVKIQKEGNHINVYFSYNVDLVELMQELGGWWFNKSKSWMFPATMINTVREELKTKKYQVNILPEIEQKQKPITKTKELKKLTLEERFKDKRVIGVYGYCKNCKKYSSLDIRGLCIDCNSS
jgi:hypothetical protein